MRRFVPKRFGAKATAWKATELLCRAGVPPGVKAMAGGLYERQPLSPPYDGEP